MASQHATLVGSTGLVGSHILQALARSSVFESTYALTRKPLPSHDKINPIVEIDSSKWSSSFSTMSSPSPSTFFSALGTTRGAAGGFDKQRLIDYDLNLELAGKAHESGVRIYVLVSTASASSTSIFGYTKMKGELEDAVKAIGFDHVVILRPGLLLGSRPELRPAELVVQGIAKGLRSMTAKATDFWAQDAGEVGRAAVAAGELCASGKRDKGVWILDQAEVVSLGRAGQ